MRRTLLPTVSRLFVVAVILWCAPRETLAQDESDTIIVAQQASTPARKPFFQRMIAPFEEFFMGVDTAYVSQSEYRFQALEQARYNYETYRIRSSDGKSIGFSPRKSLKLGPYIGWSIIFVGVTVDLFHMGDASNRREWDLSLYTLPFVIDLYYRTGGSSTKVDHLNLGKDINTSAAHGLRFDGFDADIRGFDITYIFNHKRFSYPAAYNQGSPQKRSSGSFLAGIGFTRHKLTIDWDDLSTALGGALGDSFTPSLLDSLRYDKITYSDLSLSGGYAYNYVFAKHWLLGASLSVGISYKYASSDVEEEEGTTTTLARALRTFRFSDLSFDFLGRVGIVYNNGRWFVGASAIINSYNYSTSHFTTSSNFGTVNLYGGINFGRRRAKTKKSPREE